MLPLTLNKKVLVNYGPDTISASSDKSIAIPYEGNNIPKHGSNFASHFEVINYTIQLAIIKGLTMDDMQTFLSQLKAKALDEKRYSIGKITSIDATKTADIFAKLCNGKYKLSSLDEQVRDGLFLRFYNDFYLDKRVLRYCLQTIILPRIAFFNTLLRHNEQNVMSMFDIIQGFSGTVDSTYVFRSDVNFDTQSASVVDAVTINLLKDKNTPILTSIQDAFNADTRALIDLAAFNAGIANLQVARDLVDIINGKNLPILFVLYFDTNNNLCAIPTGDKMARPIPIGSTAEDNIARVLNCTPSQRFTYYSQTHITGTDIQQMDHANAMVTFDIDSARSDLLQACMRMRKLSQDQTCTIVISDKVQKNDPVKQWQINDVLAFSTVTQDKQQANDNYRVALHKLHNLARTAVLELLIEAPDRASKKHILSQAKHLIYSTLTDSPFNTFGKISTLNDTVKVLQEYTDDILKVLNTLEISPEDIRQLTAKMAAIIDEAQNILPRQILAANAPFDTEVQVEAAIETKEEVKIEAQQQLKQEQSQFTEKIDSALKEDKSYKEWNDIRALLQVQNSEQNPELKTLQQLNVGLLSPEKINQLVFNDTQIYLSENFYAFSKQDPHKIGLYDKTQKQIDFVLFITNSDGTQNAMVLTDLEAQNLKISLSKWLQENSNTVSLKILTLKGYVFYENDQSELVDQHHIMEQLNFINGNIGYFIDHIEDLPWLTKEQGTAKMRFLKDHILPHKYALQVPYATFNELLTKKYLEQDPANDDLQTLLKPSIRF